MLAFTVTSLPVLGQEEEKAEKEGYQFTITKELKYTPVKDQYRSGTCWSFSGISFIESELLRLGKGEYDLSDMWPVRHAYSAKAEKYIRMNGTINFSGGGAFHDVFNTMRDHGIVPEEAYDGIVINQEKHVHGEMDNVFKAYVDAVRANKNRKLSTAWKAGFEGLLDAYLGEVPKEFTVNGKKYTPGSFMASLGLDLKDYVFITSFTHHPFYEEFILEVPDNWAWGAMHNLPLDEMMQVIDHALENGYTVAWASDVSEKGFSHKKGVAIIPEENREDMSDAEIARWQKMTEKEKAELLYSFDKPGKEKLITQEVRQEAFDNYETTDDHGMHLVGTSVDQAGNKYYLVKNSWAENSNELGGFFHASVPFVRYKTLNIVVHKDAIPSALRAKLKI